VLGLVRAREALFDAHPVRLDVFLHARAQRFAPATMALKPPAARICLVEKFVCAPAPFQSP